MSTLGAVPESDEPKWEIPSDLGSMKSMILTMLKKVRDGKTRQTSFQVGNGMLTVTDPRHAKAILQAHGADDSSESPAVVRVGNVTMNIGGPKVVGKATIKAHGDISDLLGKENPPAPVPPVAPVDTQSDTVIIGGQVVSDPLGAARTDGKGNVTITGEGGNVTIIGSKIVHPPEEEKK